MKFIFLLGLVFSLNSFARNPSEARISELSNLAQDLGRKEQNLSFARGMTREHQPKYATIVALLVPQIETLRSRMTTLRTGIYESRNLSEGCKDNIYHIEDISHHIGFEEFKLEKFEDYFRQMDILCQEVHRVSPIVLRDSTRINLIALHASLGSYQTKYRNECL